jgi:hypothetical protein
VKQKQKQKQKVRKNIEKIGNKEKEMIFFLKDEKKKN